MNNKTYKYIIKRKFLSKISIEELLISIVKSHIRQYNKDYYNN